MTTDEMEMRDQFAIAAMQGILTSWERGNGQRLFDAHSIADDAYTIANAMLIRRNEYP